MLLSQKRQGVWDCHLGSSGLGSWCFVNYDLRTPWLHITLVDPTDNPNQALLTNDMVLVKQVLERPHDDLKIKSFQAVFPSDFPDNKGWGIAEVYKVQESKTRNGIIFHSLFTRFGVYRIGGPERIMAIDVLPRDTTVLYEAKKPSEPKRYYGG